MATAILNAARLRELLHYCPETGVFLWKVWRGGAAVAGSVAGSPNASGYIYMTMQGRKYLAHRLAWLYVTGSWPDMNIDHIDGNPSNNRIANLRDVSQTVNMQNTRRPHKDSATGVLGVTRIPNKAKNQFFAQIRIGVKNISIGYFETADVAHAAYLEMRNKYYPINESANQ